MISQISISRSAISKFSENVIQQSIILKSKLAGNLQRKSAKHRSNLEERAHLIDTMQRNGPRQQKNAVMCLDDRNHTHQQLFSSPSMIDDPLNRPFQFISAPISSQEDDYIPNNLQGEVLSEDSFVSATLSMAQGLDEEKMSPQFLDRKFETFSTAISMFERKGVALLEPAIISEMQNRALRNQKQDLNDAVK